MTHGSISGPGHGPRWESKCGPDLRMQHGLDELRGSTYGRVIAFYRQTAHVENGSASSGVKIMKSQTAKSYLTSAEKKTLAGQVKRVPAELRASFETAFQAWKNSWYRGGLAISSDPHTRAIGVEFDGLIALGSAVLPLVIEKLADPENYFALQLYDAMQTNIHLLVQFEPDDERILEGEQGRARRVVQRWFANR